MANALGIEGNTLRIRDNAVCIGCCGPAQPTVSDVCGLFWLDCDDVPLFGAGQSFAGYSRDDLPFVRRCTTVVEQRVTASSVALAPDPDFFTPTTSTVVTTAPARETEQSYWTVQAQRFRFDGVRWVSQGQFPSQAEVVAASNLTNGSYVSGTSLNELPPVGSASVGDIAYRVSIGGVIRTTSQQGSIRRTYNSVGDSPVILGGAMPTVYLFGYRVRGLSAADLTPAWAGSVWVPFSLGFGNSNKLFESVSFDFNNDPSTRGCVTLDQIDSASLPSAPVSLSSAESTVVRTGAEIRRTVSATGSFDTFWPNTFESSHELTVRFNVTQSGVEALPQYPSDAPDPVALIAGFCASSLARSAPPPTDPRIAALSPENNTCRGCGDG